MTAYNKDRIENGKSSSKAEHYVRSLVLAVVGGGAAYAVTSIFF